MKIEIQQYGIKVVREPNDRKFYGNAAGESNFLYAVKKALQKLGYDVIKKRMYKDGHMVSDMQQYIRTRDKKTAWFNDHWAICGLNDDFNEGEAFLRKAEIN